MEQRTLELKTLTPIWTGGADGTMDRIHETGIIGSLRWWYEALVRGVGGWACDPSDTTCRFDADRFNTPPDELNREQLRKAGLCDVCQLFGATGWRRRFRLILDTTRVQSEAQGSTESLKWPEKDAKRFEIEHKGRKPKPAWFLRPGYEGTLGMRIMGGTDDRAIVEDLLWLIAQCGGLGAKAQLGYGIVTIVKPIEDPARRRQAFSVLESILKLPERKSNPQLPNICRMFFASVPLDQDHLDEQSKMRRLFQTKAHLRDQFRRDESERLLRHTIMGYAPRWNGDADERRGSMVNVSRPFFQADSSLKMRIGGWTPATVDLAQRDDGTIPSIGYEEIQQRIRAYLTTMPRNGTPITWEPNAQPTTSAITADMLCNALDLTV